VTLHRIVEDSTEQTMIQGAHSFPKLMYGRGLDSSLQHPHFDIWIPLEFANEASFHGALSYAAAHLGHLRGEGIPPLALLHSIKSTELINSWLGDPSMVVSDAAISAVMRLTSFEVCTVPPPSSLLLSIMAVD
jgi:hypothetical protein